MVEKMDDKHLAWLNKSLNLYKELLSRLLAFPFAITNFGAVKMRNKFNS